MPDLFGTPLGEIAYNKNALVQMQTLGAAADASLTPARRELLEAQARREGALATGYESDAAALLAASQSDREYRAWKTEQDARALLAEIKPQIEGRPATVADLPNDGMLSTSATNPILEKAKWMEERGVAGWEELYDKGMEVSQSQAIRNFRQGQANQDAEQDRRARAEEIGELAADAGRDELSWLYAQQDPRARKLLPPQLLGQPYEQVKDHLAAIARQATTTVQEAKIRQDEAKEKRAKDLAAQQDLTARIQRRKLKAQADLAEDRLERTRKNDGEDSEAALEAKEALIELRRVQATAERVIMAHPAPLDPDDREVGKAYMSFDGKIHAVWGGVDEAGEEIWYPIDPSELERFLEDEPGSDFLPGESE